MIEYLMETQRIRLPSLWKEASGNWRGETTCREYRREQLLTPTAHQSAVRLGKAKRTRLRMIRLYIGLTLQRRESSTLSTDAYLLAKCLHLVLFFFFFCSIPEVKAGCLPSVLFEAQINQTDCPSHTIRRDLLVTLTCCKLLLLFFFFIWTGPVLWLRCTRDSPERSIPPIPFRTHLRPATFLVDRLQTRKTQRRPLSNSSMGDLTSSTAKNACGRMRT